ncbi:hypothetical protein [Altererythrobacter aquiaggeris]|uniref:hypothetical protein n=1 Tax=Aestuarierythrobacter aquiaggeris TaxID=1898396 RepID=UPI0030193C65
MAIPAAALTISSRLAAIENSLCLPAILGDFMVRALAPILASLAALALAVPLAAQERVQLASSVFVESAPSANGYLSLSRATTLARGDRVVLLVEWTAPSNRRSFIVAAKVPASLAFQRSGLETVEISADGGRSWGRLGSLRIGQSGRLASPEDATHLRWLITPQDAQRANGRIAYSALVR